MDRGWDGTVKPMKWFDTYFDFFSSEKQFSYLLEIFQELTSSTPSFEALPYTSSIVRKITPEMLSHVSESFIKYCAKQVLSSQNKYDELVLRKLDELRKAKLIINKSLNELVELILKFGRDQFDDSEYESKRNELDAFAYPELAELKRKRRRKLKKN